MKVTPEVAQAFSNLRTNHDFKVVFDWMQENAREAQEQCVDAEGINLHRAQGAAKTYRKILDTFLSAHDILKKFHSNPPPV